MSRSLSRILTLSAILSSLPATLLAGGGPENVAIVVNAESWASLAVANEFVALRRIPPSHIIPLHHVPNFETIDVDTFRDTLLKPVLKEIEDRQLAPQIDYVVYSADLPYAVHVQKDIGDTKLPHVITPVAAVTGLTCLSSLVLGKNVDYLHFYSNFYVRRPVAPVQETPDTPWTEEEQKRYAGIFQLFKDKKLDEAAAILDEVGKAHPNASQLLYNFACCRALQGKNDEAVALLEKAFKAGWLDVTHTMEDSDLAGLREREDFRALIKKMKEVVFDVAPTRSFRNSRTWSQDGEPVDVDKGRRYLLSTMLAVTSGRGTSVAQAIEGLQRSARADGTCPKGTIYFMENGDVRSKTRQWAFHSAVHHLKAIGVAAEVTPGNLPKDKPDVMGLMAGTAGFDWKSCGSTVLPGAICEHLTSTGGVLVQDGGQTPLTDFLKAGAAGASGTVTEPYSIQAKFPMPFIHLHYARGCTLAEAFYQSVAMPYQLLIVGDPLCAPWARPPAVQIEGLKADADVKGKIALRTTRPANDPPVRQIEWFVDGRRMHTCKPDEVWELDTSSLTDGFHELRAVAVADGLIETQGRAIVPVMVSNRGMSASISGPEKVVLGQPVPLRVGMKGAARIEVVQNSRTLGKADGESGEVVIDSARLGLGTVMLQAIGQTGGDAAQRVASVPLRVQVDAPEPQPALSLPPTVKTEKGLSITPEGGKSAVAESLRKSDWLSAAGVTKGQAFTMDGLFDVPSDGLYQFQVRTRLKLALRVDDKVVAETAGNNEWQFVPCSLRTGTHRVQVKAEGGELGLDIRFGGEGTFSLDSGRFRHEVAEAPDPAVPEPK